MVASDREFSKFGPLQAGESIQCLEVSVGPSRLIISYFYVRIVAVGSNFPWDRYMGGSPCRYPCTDASLLESRQFTVNSVKHKPSTLHPLSYVSYVVAAHIAWRYSRKVSQAFWYE